MPELPEVETVVRTLAPRVVGATIRAVQLHRPEIVEPAGTPLARRLVAQEIQSLARRAKRIIFGLSDGNRFYIHLGMTGRLTVHLPGFAVRKHTHLIMEVVDTCSQRVDIHFCDPRRFGGVYWLGDSPADDGLGPEPLNLKASELAGQLAGSRRPIKSALLDQSVVAGLGNIYADEALFASGIHPLRLAGSLSTKEITQLNLAIRRTLTKAIKHRGSTLRDYVDAQGDAGGFQLLHNVYGRDEQPCRKCRMAIERIVLSGRSTCYCPVCQARGK